MHRSLQACLLACLLACLCTPLFAAQPPSDLPRRKAGLWEQKMTVAGPAPHATSMSMCTDEKSDDLLQQPGQGSGRCETMSVRRESGAVVVDAVCKDGAATIRTQGRFSGDFTTSYRGDIRSTFDPPLRGVKEMSQTIEGRYVGPCKPGQKPGDITVDGMGGLNVNELMGADPAKMQEMMRRMQQAYPQGKPAHR